MPSMNFYRDDSAGQDALPTSIPKTSPEPSVLVGAQVTDALVRQLTGSDAQYYEATGNARDAAVVRERAQRMWDALVDIARTTGDQS